MKKREKGKFKCVHVENNFHVKNVIVPYITGK